MQATTTERRPTTSFPVIWAVKLIDRLHALYGTKFLQQWEGIDKAQLALSWAEELNGFTGQEIATGLAACKTRTWPPTLPEFIGFCRPWLDPETAFREAVLGMTDRARGNPGQWSHPAVYWTAVRIGAHDLVNNGWQTMRGRWEVAFRDVLQQGQWHPIPDPAKQIAAPGADAPTRQQAQVFMDQVKQVTGASVEMGETVADHKAWARRILQNPARRSPAAIQMAKAALGECA